jgi:hypothetical protein
MAKNNRGILPAHLLRLSVYLDAVCHDFPLGFAETDWPEAVWFLLNIYEENSILNGGDIDDSEVWAGAILEEANTTTDPGWNASLDHFSIDDDLQVQQLITTRLGQLLLR